MVEGSAEAMETESQGIQAEGRPGPPPAGIDMALHELRTPLTAMRLQLENLLSDSAPPQRGAVEGILRNMQRFTRLLDDLSDAVTPGAGSPLQDDTVDLCALVRDVAAEYECAAQDHGLTLATELADVGPVRADRQRLLQVLQNLMNNALRHAHEGGQITLRVYEDDGICIDVEDDGMGLHPSDIERAFEPYWRRDQEGSAGMGLGLAVARCIMEAHGGTLTCTSAGPGHGACFTARLPVAG